MSDLMNTREVADYLRIKERKLYEMIRTREIPCTRVMGKWLFSKKLIDRWLAQNTESSTLAFLETPVPPNVIAGSHDPLLDWAVRESGCGLALLTGGSLDGLAKMASGEALACGLHVFDPETQSYNRRLLERLGTADGYAITDVVLISWAVRTQGLMLAPDNPGNIQCWEDVAAKGPTIALRQEGAGSWILFDFLVEESGMDPQALHYAAEICRSESDLAGSLLERKADVGLGVAAAASGFRLGFLPLRQERFDLLIFRKAFFDPPFQKLLAFTRTESFRAKAEDMGGYDVSACGDVVFNTA